MEIGAVVAQATVNGLMIGAIYVLMAIGFTLVFGIMRIVNFAHGEFYMVSAFVFSVMFGTYGQGVLQSLVLAVAAAIVLGVLVERLVFRRFRYNELNGMIASVGIAMILQNTALLVMGPSPMSVPSVVTGIVRFGGMAFPWSRLTVIIVSAVVVGLLYLFISRTQTGRAIRAVAQDSEIALAQGIRVDFIFPLAFALGVGFAGLAGALMAPILSVSPFIGLAPTMKAFVIVVLGGLGSIPGAVLGGLLVGMMESFAGTFVSASTAEILQLVLVIVVILLRPWGLLGAKEREA